jgi:ribosomal protein L11 methyltransferase
VKCPAGLDISQPGRFHEAFGEEETLAASVFRDGTTWTLEYLFENPPDADYLISVLAPLLANENMPAALLDTLSIEPVAADQDWLELCYTALPAFSVGRFFVYGSHCDGIVPDGQTGLQIDAVQAFGSGSHGTTSGCLHLLQTLAQDTSFTPRHILDMGCGSGILGIAAAHLWNVPVIASDIEEESAAATHRHAATNHVADRVTALHAVGFDHPQINQGAPYDLIIANILPSVLDELAGDILAHGSADGYVMLSGIQDDQVERVLARYLPLGYVESARLSIENWTSLLLRRR